MTSKVFFADARANKWEEGLVQKTATLFDRAGFPKLISKDDLVAIKTHFGDTNNSRYLRPVYIRQIVEKVKECGGNPIVVETTGHGWWSRSTSWKYLNVAARNGFTPQTLDAPIVILDGPLGMDYEEVEIKGNILNKVLVGRGLHTVNVLISAAHFKGHGMSGFGGALKNVGIGCVSKIGKGMVHGPGGWRIDPEKCDACEKCLALCPTYAIKIVKGKAIIDQEKCVMCGHCTVICPQKAVKAEWTPSREGTLRMVDSASGVIKLIGKEKTAFFNFVIDVTPDCDCWPWSDQIIVPDQGILASTDPVAIDKAALDLVTNAPGIKGSKAEEKEALEPGSDKFALIHGHKHHHLQLEAAEQLGLGSTKYELVKIL
jgi:uncharacterized Fe-S center protein